MPNRSASITTIVEAFGTSTPTSITVVAISTSISPAANRVITESFSSAGSRPCRISTRSPASGSASSSAICSTAMAGRGLPFASASSSEAVANSPSSSVAFFTSSPIRGQTTYA